MGVGGSGDRCVGLRGEHGSYIVPPPYLMTTMVMESWGVYTNSGDIQLWVVFRAGNSMNWLIARFDRGRKERGRGDDF